MSAGRIRKKLARWWYGAFVVQRWTIGIASGEDCADGSWILRGRLLEPLPGGDFLADPFVVPGTQGRVLLCEWMQVRRGRGVIARVQLDGQGHIIDIAKLIDWPPYHLSYPHVFEHDGALYCCPEACYSQTVTLYKLSAGAREVLGSQVSMPGFQSVDPTMFQHDGRWWLMCTSARDGQSNTHLYAFHANSPFGPWQPHAANPVVTDISRARPAGRVFASGGRLYRPAQDCSVRYGGGLRLLEITHLTPQEYAETPCWTVNPPLGNHGQHGVHTMNADGGTIVYDAYSLRFSPWAWLYRLRERFR
jgi:hypothetical protein